MDSTEFLFWNDKTFDLSKDLRDTLRIAEAHWDLANFYFRLEKSDSAFYHYRKAAKLYKQQNDDAHYARMLLNIGILQRQGEDFLKSEVTTLKALKIFIEKEDKRRMYIGYNSLGLLYNELGEYHHSLNFHNKALNELREMNEPLLESTTLNNMGIVHANMKNYKKALFYYTNAMAIDSIEQKDPQLYAMLLDNSAYSEMKLDLKAEVLPKLRKSLKLRESIGHKAGIIINKFHLGEYFLLVGDTLQAEENFVSAKNLAEEHHFHLDVLKALHQLSKIKKIDPQGGFNSYVTLKDSLESEERAVQAKFAPIELQTDEYISQNRQLSEERSWIIVGSGSALAVLFLTFVFWRQRANNKKLELEHEQQKMNAQIYNLMLSQEQKIEEERKKEKKRISRELHDGVLSTMYGIRFNLSHLLNRTDQTSLKEQQDLLDHLRHVEEEIRNISRDLQNEEALESKGFVQVVENYCREQRKVLGIEGSFYSDPSIPWKDVPVEVQVNLFRIIQEGVQNIRKHSEAEEFHVKFLRITGGKLQLSISDNGTGFQVNERTTGIGLKNIRNRVEQMNGRFRISSGCNGTELFINI